MTAKRPVKRLLHTGLQNYDHTDLDDDSVFFAQALRAKSCPCCSIPLTKFEHELTTTKTQPGTTNLRWLCVEICLKCGWWHFQQDFESDLSGSPRQVGRATWWELTHALQTEINIAADTLPVEDLRRHLLRRWEDRKLISAQAAEDLVASLLKEHLGGEVHRLTANANAADGGIDLYVVIDPAGAVRRAVQVKRRITGDVEAVTDVRNFVGAMVLEGFDEGIFVTTASRFSKPAAKTPLKAKDSKFRLGLELIDGERLFEILAATTTTVNVLMPPRVTDDQEWRHSSGRTVSSRDLFSGDLARAFGA